MEQLYELNSISYNSVVYKIQSAIPNKVFKIRIDFSKILVITKYLSLRTINGFF